MPVSQVLAVPLALAAALLASGCAHGARGHPGTAPVAPRIHLVTEGDPPAFGIVERCDERCRASPHVPSAAARHGVFAGTAFAGAALRYCGDAAETHLLLGAVVCAFALPVSIAAVPVGAAVGLAAATAEAQDAAAEAAGPTAPQPAPPVLAAPPPWWTEVRAVLLDGVAAIATELGYAVVIPAAVEAGVPTLHVSIDALGLRTEPGDRFRPYVTLRGRFSIDGVTVAEHMSTRLGAVRGSRESWLEDDQRRLRETLASLSSSAAEAIVGEVLLPRCSAVLAVQPDADRSVCGADAAGEP